MAPAPQFHAKAQAPICAVCTADMTLLCATFAGAAPICVVLAMYHVVFMRHAPARRTHGGTGSPCASFAQFPIHQTQKTRPADCAGRQQAAVRRPHAERKEGGTAHTVRNFDLSPIQ